MKLVAIRDDDACFFTDSARFALVHAPLLDKGLPLNVAAIPSVSANIKLIHDKLQGDYEPFITAQYRGEETCYDIGENKALVDLVSRHRCIEVAQHGYRHAFMNGTREFEIQDAREIEKMIRDGAQIMEKAFGARPAFFVAPWNRISRAAFPALAANFDGISAGWLSKDSVPLSWLPKLLIMKLKRRNYIFAGKTLVLENPGCILSKFTPVEAIRGQVMAHIERHEVTVLVTHHWEYFNDDGSLDGKFLAAYHALIAEINAQKDVRLASLSEIRRALMSA
jgi:hypothetical protein